MRLATVALLFLVIGTCFGQSFTDEERFGKTEAQVAAMKHAEWVRWYCDSSRGGQQLRVQAEKIYAVALYKENKRVLASRPQSEQKFYDDLRSKLANLAKYAFTINDAAYPNRQGASLATAETGTAINQLILDLLRSKRPTQEATFAQVRKAFQEGAEIMRATTDEGRTKYIQSHYPAMGKMLDQLESEFQSRSAQDQTHMAAFGLHMIRVATAKPR